MTVIRYELKRKLNVWWIQVMCINWNISSVFMILMDL